MRLTVKQRGMLAELWHRRIGQYYRRTVNSLARRGLVKDIAAFPMIPLALTPDGAVVAHRIVSRRVQKPA